jgi:hypothetical protein
MFLRKTSRETKSADDFWREYEEKTGEKILARCLGKYTSGWEEFNKQKDIWGLIIFTSGGFRFHHFPQTSWIESIFRGTGSEAPKEKTIFIPNEMIIKQRFIRETNWWKKIFSSYMPQLIIIYKDGDGNERQLLLEADTKLGNFDLSQIKLDD